MASADPPARIRPRQLAHVVFYTNQLPAMAAWYADVLEADLAFGDERIAFLSFDAEHHRIALVAVESYAPRPTVKTVGFYHAAFSYDTLGALLANYERLSARGIAPFRTIHHGPTVSLYYRDPDGNAIELQVDAFADGESAKRWMTGPAFARNPVGVEFDMAEYLAAYRAGVPEAWLLKRPDDR